MTFSYVCSECGRDYPIEPSRYLCDACASLQEENRPLRGILEVRLSGDLSPSWAALADKKRPLGNIGDFPADTRDLLPVERSWFPSVPVGGTPLWEPEGMRKSTGFPQLYLKDDGLNPTGSLKDRASFLVAAFARKHGLKQIVVASTGNAGSSMSGIGAASGIDVKLYLPASAPQAKMAQALQYGADLVQVDGTYDDAYDRSMADVAANGGFSRNTAHNPLTIEGKKTVSLEIFLQLGGVVPDSVFVPTGDGVILSGVYKGFEDLVSLGLANKVPTVYCVQAQGSSAIARALETGEFTDPVSSVTVADSISVDVPRGGQFALGRLKRHDGQAVLVSDDEILDAQIHASRNGLFCEPAAAAAVAGFLKMKSRLNPKSRTVILITGNGLKDIVSALKGVQRL